MDNQNYSTPLRVSRACFDEVFAAMLEQRRLQVLGADSRTAICIDMRGVLLMTDEPPVTR